MGEGEGSRPSGLLSSLTHHYRGTFADRETKKGRCVAPLFGSYPGQPRVRCQAACRILCRAKPKPAKPSPRRASDAGSGTTASVTNMVTSPASPVDVPLAALTLLSILNTRWVTVELPTESNWVVLEAVGIS